MALFGMVGTMMGFAALGPLSLVAGGLMGRKGSRDEQKRQLAIRQQQAKRGIRQYVDDVVFQVSKHRRDTLRDIQRELRDTNLARAKELGTTAEETARAARAALDTDRDQTRQRLSELDDAIADLVRLQAVAEGLIER